MPTLRDLKAERAQVWSRQTELIQLDEMTTEQAAEYDRQDERIEQLNVQIDRQERHDVRSGHLDAEADPDVEVTPGVQPPARDRDQSAEARAFELWMRRGQAGLDAAAREQLVAADPDQPDLRAQTITPDTAGGFLVPEGFRNVVTETRLFFGGMRQVSSEITTETGQVLPWPSNDDTGNEGEYLSEKGPVSEQDLDFGQISLQAHAVSSKMVKVSLPLLQDSGIDLDSFVGRKLGERVGRRENRAFTTGNGVGQPLGVQASATTGKKGGAGQETSVTHDDLVDLIHSVDVAYRTERARFMWHDLTMAAIRKLIDGNDRPLWEPSVQPGVPDRYLGHQYTINNDMPVMAADTQSILFGDFQLGYIIRDVRALAMVRITERFIDELCVAFFMWGRNDGKPDDTDAIRAYENQ